MTGRWPGPLPRVIGHRGAAAVAPENTLAGLRSAAESGVAWVEVDVRLTADGVPVLMHDATLDRTTDGAGRVSATPFAELMGLDAGGWFGSAFADEPVPTLAQAMTAASRLGLNLNVELKPDPDTGDAIGRTAARALAGRGGGDDPLLASCFDTACLAALRSAADTLPLALNAEHLDREVVAAAAELQCVAIHLGVEGATDDAVAAIEAAGMATGVFTVNDPAVAERLWAAGADYLFTDDPGRLASF